MKVYTKQSFLFRQKNVLKKLLCYHLQLDFWHSKSAAGRSWNKLVSSAVSKGEKMLKLCWRYWMLKEDMCVTPQLPKNVLSRIILLGFWPFYGPGLHGGPRSVATHDPLCNTLHSNNLISTKSVKTPAAKGFSSVR